MDSGTTSFRVQIIVVFVLFSVAFLSGCAGRQSPVRQTQPEEDRLIHPDEPRTPIASPSDGDESFAATDRETSDERALTRVIKRFKQNHVKPRSETPRSESDRPAGASTTAVLLGSGQKITATNSKSRSHSHTESESSALSKTDLTVASEEAAQKDDDPEPESVFSANKESNKTITSGTVSQLTTISWSRSDKVSATLETVELKNIINAQNFSSVTNTIAFFGSKSVIDDPPEQASRLSQGEGFQPEPGSHARGKNLIPLGWSVIDSPSIILGLMFLVVAVFGYLAGRYSAGLNLVSDSGTSTRNVEVRDIRLDRIVANPYQPRSQIDEDKLEKLAASIEEYGVVTPIQVAETDDDSYQLIAGERRVRAARQLGRETIPALIRNVDQRTVREMGFLENLQREPMNCVEKSNFYKRLREEYDFLRIEELGEMIGKSAEEIQAYDWIQDLVPLTQQALAEGHIDRTTARVIGSAEPETQRDVTAYAVNEDVDLNDVEDKIRSIQVGVNNDPSHSEETSRLIEESIALDPKTEPVEFRGQSSSGRSLQDRESDDEDPRILSPP
ncbi:MAG: ParB/RepB/Spo0J family partition protein [bacterium]